MKPGRVKTLLTIFLAGMFLLHLAIAWNARELLRKGYPDFTIFYSAGKIVRQGSARDLYDPGTQYRAQQEFAAGVSIRKGALPYNHPPFEALIFEPFTGLPFFPAYLLWDLLNLLALFALPFLLRPYVAILQRAPAAFVLFVSLAFYPIFIALLQGQDIIVLVLLFALTFVSLKKNQDFAAGGWLGLGLFRFHLVLPLLLILLLQKRKKAASGFALAAFALGMISLVLVGWQTAIRYPLYVLRLEATMGHGAIVPADMPNLRGFLQTLLTAHTPKAVTAAAVALLSVVVLLVTSARWKREGAGTMLDLGFSLSLVLTVLVSYHAFAYDLSLLFLPILLLANYFQTAEPTDRWTQIALWAPAGVLFLSPLQMVLWLRYGQLNLLAPVLLFWFWGIARLISRERARSSAALIS